LELEKIKKFKKFWYFTPWIRKEYTI
jgi:hypothetical protein